MLPFTLRRADLETLMALLLLLCWTLPFGLLCWLVAGELREALLPVGSQLRVWCLASLACAALVGCYLGLQVRRAWIWRRRRNPRPSRELQAERQRLARELHDAVGSQLVNASLLLDRSEPRLREVHEALDRCLLDLRLLVDTMDGDHCVLTDRLAMLRHRLKPVIERRAIALQWETPDMPQAGLPTGEAAQHLGAIVQEAVSNVLQHSKATQLQVTLEQQQGRWHLRIQDDGVGATGTHGGPRGGSGLQGMAYRATRAGAQLVYETGLHGRGTCVHVHWPVPPPRR